MKYIKIFNKPYERGFHDIYSILNSNVHCDNYCSLLTGAARTKENVGPKTTRYVYLKMKH